MAIIIMADLDVNNKVVNIIDCSDSIRPSAGHVDAETWCETNQTHLEGGVSWKEGAEESGGFRKNRPSIGMNYDPQRDAFIEDQPFTDWTLNETTCLWEPPTPRPNNMMNGNYYSWQWSTANSYWFTPFGEETDATHYWDNVNSVLVPIA